MAQEAKTELSTATANAEDRDLLNRAQALLDLLRDAERLGWSLTLSPDQYRLVIEILESGELHK